MNIFISLRILDKFSFLYKKIGVDYDDMRLILKTKLTIDSRENNNLLNKSEFSEFSSHFKLVQIIYAIIAFAMMTIMINGENTFISMVIYFSILMSFMLTIFMSDFSSVILDVKDNEILATRGISSKTLSASKITHIMIYMIRISLSLSGFSLVASIKYGPTFLLVFFIEILLVNIFIIVLSGLIYMLALKLFDGEKLKDVISIIQIGMTILFSGAYFIIMNITDNVNLLENINLGYISYLLPPFWFAAPLEIIVSGNKNETLLMLSFLALVVPILSILIYMKFSPVFERKRIKLNNESYSKGKSEYKRKHKTKMKFSKVICRDKEEKVFYEFISKIIRKDRDFRYRIYPAIGSYCTFPIFMIFKKNEKYFNSYMYLFLYFCLMVIPTIMISLKYSKDYEASYIYKTINIKNKMAVHKAAIKACLINVIIPIYLIPSIIFVYFYKFKIIKHLVVIFLVLVFITIITFKVLDKSMPFSCQINMLKKNWAIAENYLIIILVFIMGLIHFVISIISPLAVNIYIIVLLTTNIILFRSSFEIKNNKKVQ